MVRKKKTPGTMVVENLIEIGGIHSHKGYGGDWHPNNSDDGKQKNGSARSNTRELYVVRGASGRLR